ncbi:copper amine oxidase N-terminal domain-containing protein [Ferviditalea candida]|uniref:Copper amine oxidase N-terminal domain-containing protein n=1 Tax=Ferviditalea candida TaxID=3108399 RepID=A0ABU5ZLB8_9BACL|nr:copper amine oxidase N-terminal domain-containing protein [Paenibacillaceae bacterium T2]
MKKWVSASLSLAMFFGLATGISSAQAKTPAFVSVVMDGEKIWFPDAQAFVDENSRTLVPVRFVAEKMNAKVGWEAETMTVPIERGDQRILLTIGESTAMVNGKEETFDTKAIISGGRTFVPLRFVSEVLGATVKWDDAASTALISTREGAEAKYDQWGRLIRTIDLPKNAKDYPYILADVPNEMYEMKYPHSHPDPTERKVSSELYSTIPEFKKENVDIWMSRLKAFGAVWLNADYQTIDYNWADELFANKVQLNGSELKYIKRYVDWVKENHIQMEGYLDPEPSMIYDDGFGGYHVRSKFRIKFDAFTNNERLIYDTWFPNDVAFEKGVWYEGYTDIYLSTNVGGNWGRTLKVDPQASLFRNYLMKKAG